MKIDDNTPIAIKFLIDHKDADTLKNEKQILCSLPMNSPFPKYYYYENNKDRQFLIESLVGPSLDKLYSFCEYSFDLITICNIGIDIINNLEFLHNINYIHNDIKLDNIGILFHNNSDNDNKISCVLLDFGKCLKVDKYKTNISKENNNKRARGNFKFASLNSMNKGQPSKKDDLESLCYLILYLYKKKLPWSGINKSDKSKYFITLLKEKMKFDIKKECDNNFNELIHIFTDIKYLKYNEKPNYQKYKNFLLEAIKRNKNLNLNRRFKWEKKFSDAINGFKSNNNFEILNYTINTVFKGLPSQLSFDYLNQFENIK